MRDNKVSDTFQRIAPQARKNSRAFTLTETAIVLGVVGAIIGALFVAYSAASRRILLNQGVDEISFIVGNMRSLYAGHSVAGVATTAASAALEKQFVGQNVFPNEMLIGAYAYNPWDQTQALGSAQIGLVSAAASGIGLAEFTITYFNLPPDVCADLLVRNSTPGPDTGLYQINVVDTTGASNNTYAYNTGTATYTLPISTVTAAVACPYKIPGVPSPLFDVQWTYSLGG